MARKPSVTDKTNSVIQGLYGEIDRLSDEAWKLHSRLAEEYDHRSEQWADMVRLGDLAKAMMKITETINLLK